MGFLRGTCILEVEYFAVSLSNDQIKISVIIEVCKGWFAVIIPRDPREHLIIPGPYRFGGGSGVLVVVHLPVVPSLPDDEIKVTIVIKVSEKWSTAFSRIDVVTIFILEVDRILPVGFENGTLIPVVPNGSAIAPGKQIEIPWDPGSLGETLLTKRLEFPPASHRHPELPVVGAVEDDGGIDEGEDNFRFDDEVPVQDDDLVHHDGLLADDPVTISRGRIGTAPIACGIIHHEGDRAVQKYHDDEHCEPSLAKGFH